MVVVNIEFNVIQGDSLNTGHFKIMFCRITADK